MTFMCNKFGHSRREADFQNFMAKSLFIAKRVSRMLLPIVFSEIAMEYLEAL